MVGVAQAFLGETKAELAECKGQVWIFPLTYQLGNYGKRAPWCIESDLSTMLGRDLAQDCRSCSLGLIVGSFP